MDSVWTLLPHPKKRLSRATNHMDKNHGNTSELELLELSLQTSDRELLEWLAAVLAERDRKRLPSIQID